jgi:hypothetical protein
MSFEEANQRFKEHNHTYSQQAIDDYRRHYPYVFESNLTGSKWAGVL